MVKRDTTTEAHPPPEGTPGEGAGDTAHEGILSDLIEVERRVGEAVREAEAEAARAIAEAESRASSQARAHDDVLDAALSNLESSLEQERSAALAEIERHSDDAARRHRDVDEATVRALAEFVAKRVAEVDLDSSELQT